MANVLIYDIETGEILNYLTSVHTPDYEGRDDVLINPDLKGRKPKESKVSLKTKRLIKKKSVSEQKADEPSSS